MHFSDFTRYTSGPIHMNAFIISIFLKETKVPGRVGSFLISYVILVPKVSYVFLNLFWIINFFKRASKV